VGSPASPVVIDGAVVTCRPSPQPSVSVRMRPMLMLDDGEVKVDFVIHWGPGSWGKRANNVTNHSFNALMSSEWNLDSKRIELYSNIQFCDKTDAS
jgi:hypothetical protein